MLTREDYLKSFKVSSIESAREELKELKKLGTQRKASAIFERILLLEDLIFFYENWKNPLNNNLKRENYAQ